MLLVRIIAGPTASGKSYYAEKLAENGQYEIINADSIQLYKDLKILTARPNHEGYLYGTIEPNFQPDVMWWKKQAIQCIEAIQLKNKIPLIVGGTGFYIQTLIEGLSPIPDIDVNIIKEVRAIPHDDLWYLATKEDPLIEENLPIQNIHRIQRAVAVKRATGKSLFEWHAIPKKTSPFEFNLEIILNEKENINIKIQERLEKMIEDGVIDEVKKLLQTYPLTLDYPIARAIGVKEIALYLDNKISYETMLEKITIATQQYAKRQITWFKRYKTNCNIKG